MKNDFDRAELIRRALEQQPAAYAPYSGYYVAAAALGKSGRIYTGVNVENASYPAGTCAERNAIQHAVACGDRRIRAIAIVGGKQGSNRNYCVPCRIRQTASPLSGMTSEALFTRMTRQTSAWSCIMTWGRNGCCCAFRVIMPESPTHITGCVINPVVAFIANEMTVLSVS